MRTPAFNIEDAWFRQLFELSPDPTWIIEGNRFVECNEAALRTLGYASREAFLNVHPSKLSPPAQPDGEDSYAKAERMMALAVEQGLHRFEWMHTKADGTDFPAEVTLSAIDLHDRKVIYCVWRDITERKQMEEEVRQLAFYDALTHLANRRLLYDRLSQTIAANKRSGRHGAMIFLDLDNFKLLNDTHGHMVGDMLLIEAANRLKSCVREMDTLARFGGDEFVVMIAELDVDRAASVARVGAIAEKVRTALARPYTLRLRPEGEAPATIEHQCTASIGVALFGKDEISRESILKWADTAMYRAKEEGRNLIRFYEPSD
ncbi:MAG: GGDEF domain-containing protein [Burkholderiales bacterium]|nr:GGDEF domain-containing protein [Burkholderiales bacterium]